MVTAKSFDATTGYFQDMKKVLAGGYDAIKRRMQAPTIGVQVVEWPRVQAG